MVALGCCSSPAHRSATATTTTFSDNPAMAVDTTVVSVPMTSAAPITTATTPSSTSTTTPPTLPPTTPETTTTLAASGTPTLPVASLAPGETLPQHLPVPPEGQERYVQLGTIQIPAIGIDAPLGEGVTLTNLNRGPGHWPGTALPGHVGNVVIGAHRVSHTHPFRDVDKLQPGDTVIFSVAGGSYTYVVTGTEVVLPTEVRVLDQTVAYTATLFACTPKGQTSHRIIIHLQLSSTPA
jgi:sortase A